MASYVTMPRLSDSMEEGTILDWIVEEGGEVKRGEPLVEIETDKANMTYEADTDGILIEIVAKEGDTLPIGEVIARIGEAGEKPSGESKDEGAEEDQGEEPDEGNRGDGDRQDDAESDRDEEETISESEERADPARAQSGNGASADGGGERVKASPVARRMARDLGVELARLEGSGPGGRIVKADVEAAARGDGKARERAPDGDGAAPERAREKAEEAKEKADTAREVAREAAPTGAAEPGGKGHVETQELSRLQQTVSRRMAESKATAPDYVLHMDVDMSLCVELRRRLKEVEDPAPSFNDMVVKACANALRDHPRVNGAYRDGRFELYSRINVGVAVAAQDTLVVPTIHDADKKSLGEIAREARELIERVREGKITPPDVAGGTFTVSNLGMYGVDSFSAVINPPQAALLTVGALKKRPAVADGGRIVAKDQMTLSLVCDHRILYGADGAEFLARIGELLEQPLALAL